VGVALAAVPSGVGATIPGPMLYRHLLNPDAPAG